ncbi:MAG: ribosomal protein S18-alanine N-acetyltransferase [Acidimicrobiia bacterium]
MTTLTLAALTEADLGEALDLERRTYSTPWSERVFRDELEAPGRTYIKAVAGGSVVGYAGLMMVGEEAHITTVVVDPDHRGGGVGTRMVLQLVEVALGSGARSLTLEVRVSNRAAQALYRRFGMSPVGVRKKYYVDEDALIMWAHDIDSDGYSQRLVEIRDSLT